MNISKKPFVIVAALCEVLSLSSCLGDAAFAFANRYASYVDAPIFDAQGNGLAGTNYLADLVIGLTQDSLQPVYTLDSPHVLVAGLPFLAGFPGYFQGEAVVAPNVEPGEVAWLQVRAWETSLGATYDEVAALGLGGYGESPLFQGTGMGPWGELVLGTPLYGLQSFSLRPVIPEPSAAWLLLLGLPLLLHRRRKYRNR